ncbi:MAG TPA: NAD(P)(+) transhydrogenase (Re/Si-specific) subunit beta, partial [Clostridia bacterium]|nr:NAD(P)(+) transhydrogenase (Re/Si-specific) subunit beta [Clostridia bacterium]
AIVVGAATLSGSLIAAGKLHRLIPQKPIVLKGHMSLTLGTLILSLIASLLATILGATGVIPNNSWSMAILMLVILISSLAFGVIFSIRVGGADMPITISLLNSLSGVAGAIAGLAMNDLLLVAIGGIVGASGLLLTQAMCKSMNRKLIDILTGKTSAHGIKATSASKVEKEEDKPVEVKEDKKVNQMDILKNAKKVIIVPGYGMAIAQAQYLVKNLADMIRGYGAVVKYAIHPVAGRMPGHMNVLLCEADVDYEDLYEMDDINDEFKDADATIVIGANDVLNPAANTEVDTPIYGMPVLNVNDCKNIFIFNYDKNPGYAGVNNPIYDRTEGVYMHLGNAAETLKAFMDGTETAEDPVSFSTQEAKPSEQAILKSAKNVIIVPGYGMAIAQAQHLVKELADKLRGYGANVKFAIHPVAGRMPGHMNVLLCEADVDYEDLYEMDDINDEFKDADATIVVGANDVLNPAANTEVDTPIYGMPVLHVNDCKNIFIFNYDKNPGYAGVDNPIYTRKNGVYLYLGNAKDTLQDFISKLS